MSLLESERVCEVTDVTDDSQFRDFIRSNPSGVAIISEPYGENRELALPSDTGDFVKWLKQYDSTIHVEAAETKQYISRRSHDIWLPLFFLAHDIALPFFLNIVSCYLYDKEKGSLKGDDATQVHLNILHEDKQTGTVKSFNFRGDNESLKAAIKQFDVNEFFDE
jgi:hypothetical protein